MLPAFAGTIPFSYAFTGAAAGPPEISNGFLDLNGAAAGTVNGLGGVQFLTHNHVDLSNGLNHGRFQIVFPDGNRVFGDLFEDNSHVSLETSTGPFTQVLTFTGGTGMFAGATGSASGGGDIFPTHFVTSGSGSLSCRGS